MPSPVAAEPRPRPDARPSRRRSRSGSATSVLLTTNSSGTASAPISSSTCAPPRSGSAPAARGVDHVQQEVGVGDFLQRRPERLDELVREAADEADGVGDEGGVASAQPQPPRGGIERREQAVLHEHVGVGEPVEQRRLACVRVADEGDGRESRRRRRLALRGAVLGDAVEVAFELRDTREDATTIDLELRLTGPRVPTGRRRPPRPAGSAACPLPRRRGSR